MKLKMSNDESIKSLCVILDTHVMVVEYSSLNMPAKGFLSGKYIIMQVNKNNLVFLEAPYSTKYIVHIQMGVLLK